MKMVEWKIGSISIEIITGPVKNREFDFVVTSKGIKIGLDPTDPLGKRGGPAITFMEKVPAQNVKYWPDITMLSKNRREQIFKTVTDALDDAAQIDAKSIGLYIMSLEVARVPSWEVAEEIVRAIREKSVDDPAIESVVIVTGSAMQISSLQYALENQEIVTYRGDKMAE